MHSEHDPIEKFNRVIETYRLGLMASMGLRTSDMAKPLVGIIHGYNQRSPGNVGNAKLVEAAKVAIAAEGGTPAEIPIPGVCGSMSGGADSFRFNFPYRDLAASMAELMMSINRLDACLFIPSCDNVVPAYLMAAARVNIPSVFVTAGYMMPGHYNGKVITAFDIPKIISADEEDHHLTEAQTDRVICSACPTSGACPEIGTANTMASITEALGFSLPGNTTTGATEAALIRMVRDAARVLMQAYEKKILPRDILTREALEDAARIVLAMGGSTNVLLHILALSHEAGAGLSLEDWDALSRKTPLLCRIKPNHPSNTMTEFGEAGGVYRLLSVMMPILHRERLTVFGCSLGDAVAAWEKDAVYDKDSDCIAPLDAPVTPDGGIRVLHGNLAPEGAVIKVSAVSGDISGFTGSARVFDSEVDAARALFGGEIAEGTVLVVRYEGPKGSPGAREVMMLMHAVVGMGLTKKIAVVTDGRFSGTNLGIAVGHVAPEAPDGGPIALVRDGDEIAIDLEERTLMLGISDEELQDRRASWTPPAPKADRGLLLEWAKRGGSLSRGGVLGG
ncbi:MAG: dihydroxy-acid dehydratase [Lachnospiraceae bacterium]|nr:dihydroxy-acid dehydratase [Lachnospiraceae bacterium]